MNIVFIVGNGFDLNLGLKTSYSDFYDYYLQQLSPTSVIRKAKEDIAEEKYSTWADLERGLGEYSKKCSREDFLQLLGNIRYHLSKYLETITEKTPFVLSDLFLNDLMAPEQHLEVELRDQLYAYRSNYLNDGREDVIDIITFNYTFTMEKILNVNQRDSVVAIPRLTSRQRYGHIYHVHGILNKEMAMGVNDINQISNESFRTDDDIVELFVKPEFNDACLNGNNKACETVIINADYIVLFGVSFGDTDSKWWKLIGERLTKKRCVVINYSYDNKKDVVNQPNKKRRWAKATVSFLKEHFDITDIPEEKLPGAIFVGINKPFFKRPGTGAIKTK